MPLTPLPLRSPLDDYRAQADTLLSSWRAGEAWALDLFHHRHPRFRDDRIPWRPRRLAHDDIRDAALNHEDGRLALARLTRSLTGTSPR